MVKLDFVHENTKDVTLPIPLPEADIFTLRDARTMRIQWKKSGILIPPIGQSIASSSGRPSATGAQKRPCTPTPEPVNVTAGSPPKKKGRTTPKKNGRGNAAAAKKSNESRG